MGDKFKSKRLKKDQLYFMSFDSGYREYFSIGKNLDVMVEKILKRYNKFCIPEHEIKSLKEMSIEAMENGWCFNTYIIEVDSVSDMDYRDFDGDVFYLGDYLQKVRSENKDEFRWQHIEFSDGSNPYVSKTPEDFGCMAAKYDLHKVGENSWYAEVEPDIDLFRVELE